MQNLLWIAGIYYLFTKVSGKGYDMLSKNIFAGKPTIRLKGLTLQGVNAVITVPVTNQTSTTVPISSVQGRIVYKGAQVGTFNSATSFSIKANETTNAIINTRLTITGILDAIKTATQKGNRLSVTIEGNISSLNVNFPFSYTISPASDF